MNRYRIHYIAPKIGSYGSEFVDQVHVESAFTAADALVQFELNMAGRCQDVTRIMAMEAVEETK